MAKIKKLIKAFVPPIMFSAIRPLRTSKEENIWSGNYASWSEAEAKCTGYDAVSILEKVKNATLKVKNGEAVYERDSVLFDEIQYSWGLLAGLQKAALENHRKLCVLDFGGSLGSSYYQNKEFLSPLNELQWCIVEQAHFVNCGKAHFEDDHLKFYGTIEECLAKHRPNVLLISSVLQYLEKPYEWLEMFLELNIPYIIIDRTAFVDNQQDILTIQNVPEEIYKASYPAWFFGGKLKRSLIEKRYSLIEFDNGFTAPTIINGVKKAFWQGIIIKK